MESTADTNRCCWSCDCTVRFHHPPAARRTKRMGISPLKALHHPASFASQFPLLSRRLLPEQDASDNTEQERILHPGADKDTRTKIEAHTRTHTHFHNWPTKPQSEEGRNWQRTIRSVLWDQRRAEDETTGVLTDRVLFPPSRQPDTDVHHKRGILFCIFGLWQ